MSRCCLVKDGCCMGWVFFFFFTVRPGLEAVGLL